MGVAVVEYKYEVPESAQTLVLKPTLRRYGLVLHSVTPAMTSQGKQCYFIVTSPNGRITEVEPALTRMCSGSVDDKIAKHNERLPDKYMRRPGRVETLSSKLTHPDYILPFAFQMDEGEAPFIVRGTYVDKDSLQRAERLLWLLTNVSSHR